MRTIIAGAGASHDDISPCHRRRVSRGVETEQEEEMMGWDIWAEIDTGGEHPAEVGRSFNYTYNTSPMLYEVGISWRDLLGRPIAEVLPVLRDGLAKLEARPEHFRTMNPSNGWGSYDGLVEVLKEIITEFSKHPKATLGGWL